MNFNYGLFYRVLALYVSQNRPDEHIRRLYRHCHPNSLCYKRAYVSERVVEL